jgi:ceramide synthetase
LITNKFLISDPDLRSKFSTAAWRVVAYTIFIACSTYLLLTSTWFRLADWTSVWIEDYPHAHWPASGFKMYYFVRLSYAVHAFFAVALYDKDKKDYSMYLLHHLCEITLIFTSSLFRFYRIGLYLLVIHDPSDLALQLGKVFLYIVNGAEMKAGKGKANLPWIVRRGPDLCFGVFVLTWLVLRLIALPMLLASIWSDVVECTEPLFKTAYSWAGSMFVIRTIFSVFIGTLLVLHVLWFRMILKMAVDQMCKGSGITSDIREQGKKKAQ